MFFYFVVLLVNFQLESIIEFSDEVKRIWMQTFFIYAFCYSH